MLPFPTECDADALDCVAKCLAGTCTDDPVCQVHCCLHVLDYVQVQAAGQGPSPTPCAHAPAEFERLAAARKNSTLAAMTFDWKALIQLLLTLLQSLLHAPAPKEEARPKKQHK